MTRINVYFIKPPRGYKWIPGDRYIISLLRRIFKGKKASGIEKVFTNLCKGFDELKIDYVKNLPFKKIQPGEPVVVLGAGKYALQSYDKPNPIIAGIGLMSHPGEWPNLFKEYPVVKYLQHSNWANEMYVPYYGRDNCDLWPVGIDTQQWLPSIKRLKKFDVLVYNKIRWNKEKLDSELRLPIVNKLDQLGLTWHQVNYGQYQENEYFELLQQCRAMIFLCEHESQGIACCEALSMNVPVFAWDQGLCLDPQQYKWHVHGITATSIPFFDENCGMRFNGLEEFDGKIEAFWGKVKAGSFNPREYILENLTLKKSAERMLEIIKSVYK